MTHFLIVVGTALVATLPGVAFLLLLWNRDRRLRGRLQGASASHIDEAVSEDDATEAIVFRSSAGSRSARLRRAIESRYPLLDARRAVPRAVLAGGAAAAGLWVSMWFLKIPSGWWTMPLVGLGGVGGIWYALSWFHSRQATEFTRQFPEVIDQIVRLSAAGLPALEAIPVAAEDARAPVKPVLNAVCDGLSGGLDPDTALRTVATRVRLADFTLFAAVILLQRRAGGGISAAFATLSRTLRDRRNTALKAQTSTAQTRLTLMVLSVMPVVMLSIQKFISPQSAAILFETERGTTLLHWGVGLIVAGLLVAKAIASRVEQ